MSKYFCVNSHGSMKSVESAWNIDNASIRLFLLLMFLSLFALYVFIYDESKKEVAYSCLYLHQIVTCFKNTFFTGKLCRKCTLYNKAVKLAPSLRYGGIFTIA